MRFMYVCSHPAEKCLLDDPDVSRDMITEVKEVAKKVGVVVTGPFVAEQEHTIYAILEGDDYDSVQKVTGPMGPWGAARLIPISAAA